MKTKEEVEWKLTALKTKQDMIYESHRFALMVALEWVLREDKEGLPSSLFTTNSEEVE